MTLAQEYLEQSELYNPPSLSRSRFLYDLGSSAATYPEQSPFRLGDHMPQMPQSQWPMPHTLMPSSTIRTHNPLWGQHLVDADSMAWTGIPDLPLKDERMLTNNSLLYSQGARQNMLDAPLNLERSFWVTKSMSNGATNPDSDMLLSPVSPFYAAKNTYSSSPDYKPGTSNCSSANYIMPSGVTKVSPSPDFAPPTPQSVAKPQPGSSIVPSTFCTPVAAGRPPFRDSTIEQNGNVPMYESEYSYRQSQSSSPASAQWLPPGYVTGKATPTQGFQQNHSSRPRLNLRPNSFMASLDRNSRRGQAQWSNTPNVPAQSHFQGRFVTPLTDADKDQRVKDDETLLQMKRDGYTYRDIRKALGRKVAESTLRGRYRSLTKPRKDRLRAPKWTETDIVLLKRYVEDEFERLDVTQPSLETKQKPDKVPWMRIVELIASNGGSYKFGAATAKKKWFEVTRPVPTRSLRRRSQV
ncbi:hypothetical protein SVAN01_01765 [Stagonosporopsis vannaccii]|nr:hypothetical protein SVAN01_01765 [Stagonosporopsis vannaccii]